MSATTLDSSQLTDDETGIKLECISEIDLSNIKLAERMLEEAKVNFIKLQGAVEFQHHAIRLRYGLSEKDSIDNGGIIKRG